MRARNRGRDATESRARRIAVARARPGELNYGASPGSPNHLVMELIGVMTNVKFVHIGYKGSGPGIIELIGGHLHVSSIGFPGAMPHVKAGRLRPIAVTSIKRSSLLPDLPTIAESGLAGFNVTSWYGVFGPAKLPSDIVTKLNGEIRAMMKADDVKAKLANVGAEIETSTPQELSALVGSEITRWAKVVSSSPMVIAWLSTTCQSPARPVSAAVTNALAASSRWSELQTFLPEPMIGICRLASACAMPRVCAASAP